MFDILKDMDKIYIVYRYNLEKNKWINGFGKM